MTWSNHINDSGIIDSEYLDYIDEFVSYIIDDLGMYCTINMHHDDRIWWNAETIISDTTIMAKYVSLWTQIATYFAGYGEKLIFAAYNEPLDTSSTWDGVSSTIRDNLATVGVNFVSAVRGVSGNEDRYLCIPAYASKPYALTNVILPDDKCFSEVHIYTTEVSSFKTLIDQCIATGKPFIVGEYGASTSYYDSLSVLSTFSFFITYCHLNNIATYIWDDAGGMAYLDRDNALADYTADNVFHGLDTDRKSVV